MKRSLLFVIGLLLVIALLLGIFFAFFSGSYIVYVDSPDISFDLVSINTSHEEVLELTHLFEIDGRTCLFLTGNQHGSTDVDITFENSQTGEVGAEYHFKNLTYSPSGIVYRGSMDNDFQYWQLIFVAVAVYFLALGFWFLRKFIRLERENIFSYEAVFHGALTLISFLLAVVFIVTVILLYTRFSEQTAAGAFSVLGIFMIFVLALSLPFVLAFSILVGISNVDLIRHEGFRPVNLLGVGLGVGLTAAIVVLVWLTVKNYADLSGNAFFRVVANSAALILLFLECMLASVAFCALKSLRRMPPVPTDYVIILGCGIRPDGTLYPLLQGRADRAVEFYRERKAAGEKPPVLIPSGGQGADEPISEAEAMHRYLREQGIPEEDILLEDRSRNTMENMKFSKALIDEKTPNASVAFSTTNYHVFRSGIYASALGMRAAALGSRTRWYFWPNAFLREFVGLTVNYRRTELILALVMIILVSLLANLQTLLNLVS